MRRSKCGQTVLVLLNFSGQSRSTTYKSEVRSFRRKEVKSSSQDARSSRP